MWTYDGMMVGWLIWIVENARLDLPPLAMKVFCQHHPRRREEIAFATQEWLMVPIPSP